MVVKEGSAWNDNALCSRNPDYGDELCGVLYSLRWLYYRVALWPRGVVED